MLGELVGDLIVKPWFEGVCYWTGKAVVRLVSLGRLHVDLLARPDRDGRRKKRWQPVTFTRNGKRYVSPEVVSIVGLLVWAAVVGGIVLVAYRS